MTKLIAMVATAALLGACGGVTDAPREPVLSLTPDTVALTAIGDTSRFNLESTGAVPAGVWTSSDVTVAMVGATSGEVVSKGTGTAHVLFSHEKGTVTGVVVVSQEPAEIVAEGWPDSIFVRQELPINVQVLDRRGVVIPGTDWDMTSTGGDGGVELPTDSTLRGAAGGIARVQFRAGTAAKADSVVVVDLPPNVVVAYQPHTRQFSDDRWLVAAQVRNDGFDGEFRIMFYGSASEPYRVFGPHPIRADSTWGYTEGTQSGIVSYSPDRPTLLIVESRYDESTPWRETDRVTIRLR